MSKTPCLYTIVRFAPFVETGEFANVGIVLVAPGRRRFVFKLLSKRVTRVTGFFEQLDRKVFAATMKNLSEELTRVARLVEQLALTGGKAEVQARQQFEEVIRPRETIVKFSEPRVVLAGKIEQTLEELYGFYVARDFVTREYQEATLERGVRMWLKQARLADRFVRRELGNDEFHVTFPFVEQRGARPTKVIKPLHLGQAQPTKIIEHGAIWVARVNQLRKRNSLPEEVLFAVRGPKEDLLLEEAYQDAIEDLKATDVKVLPYADKEHIVNFAAT